MISGVKENIPKVRIKIQKKKTVKVAEFGRVSKVVLPNSA